MLQDFKFISTQEHLIRKTTKQYMKSILTKL